MQSQIFAKLFLHHRSVIGPVADIHLCHGVAFEDDEVGANAVDEPAVVADKEAVLLPAKILSIFKIADNPVSARSLGFVQGLIGLRNQMVKSFHIPMIILSSYAKTGSKTNRIIIVGDRGVFQ